jgi:hypothetical protein
MLENQRTAKFQRFGKTTHRKFTNALIRSGQDHVSSYQQKF